MRKGLIGFAIATGLTAAAGLATPASAAGYPGDGYGHHRGYDRGYHGGYNGHRDWHRTRWERERRWHHRRDWNRHNRGYYGRHW